MSTSASTEILNRNFKAFTLRKMKLRTPWMGLTADYTQSNKDY